LGEGLDGALRIMAKRTRRSETPSEAVATGEPRDRIIDALMRLAAENDFRDIGLADVAAEAEVPLSTVRRNFDGKLAILSAFSRRIDEQVLDKGPAEGDGARDRLFEILMRRFEALVPYRDALRRIIRSARRDLRFARALHRNAKRSLMWMLVGADIHHGGVLGRLAIEGTVIAYSDVLSVFLDDDEDLARTMARLDHALRRGERAMEWLDGLCAFVPSFGGRFRDRPRRSGEEEAVL
jgi:AcrR family transcriptional regulator